MGSTARPKHEISDTPMAKQQSGRRTALRLLAIANALDGMSRAQAARAVGTERQSLCDAIKRFNTEGITGLIGRPKGHRRERLEPFRPSRNQSNLRSEGRAPSCG